eukprot:CAMPEP_0118689084 /NCGR_PEP_ID=MMETSP0800-20121206/9285_1 /TAXON_ID=210618 ORGANISM="Striatella unipunctata, Strain CCMP2910" /NCGR_SAMPLE_ID=MMETSP0800 /ASSEMBLY_ACC=CAM_ASM_000638 /LENGTH=384 /DNA_ID=CAMNT_0006586427 /DNA_START=113 /DNA_END=1263 /DNA_ORIENTATION=+
MEPSPVAVCDFYRGDRDSISPPPKLDLSDSDDVTDPIGKSLEVKDNDELGSCSSSSVSRALHPKGRMLFEGVFPPGFDEMEELRVFDESKHLQLEEPFATHDLKSLGYDDSEEHGLSTSFAISDIMRLLSDEGVDCARAEIDRVKPTARSTDRFARVIRGATFRSKFLRDLVHSTKLTNFLSEVVGTPLVPHVMECQNAHLNLPPLKVDYSKPVDKWHHDTTDIVLVIFLTPEDKYTGGKFEYIVDPVDQAKKLIKSGNIPKHKLRQLEHQSPGFGVIQQGWRVMHRASPVLSGNDRITLVLSYYPSIPPTREGCQKLSNTWNGPTVDPEVMVLADWARFRAWRAARMFEVWTDMKDEAILAAFWKLVDFVKTCPYTEDRELIR